MRIWLAFLMMAMFVPVLIGPAGIAVAQEQPTLDIVPFGADPAPISEGEAIADSVREEFHEGDDHATEGGGLPQFDPTWFPSQIFWLTVAFTFLYVFFAKRTLPELSGVIDNRKNHIQADLTQAEKLTAEAESVQSTYEAEMEEAQNEATKAVADVHAAIAAMAAEQSSAHRQKAEAEIARTEERIEAAKAEAMDEMSTIVADVAAQAVEKIIGVAPDSAQAKTVVSRLADNPKKAA